MTIMNSNRCLALAIVAALGATTATDALADARVRVAHFAPFAAEADARTVNVALNNNGWMEDIAYGTVSEYADVAAGTYDAAVTPIDATDPALTGSLTFEDETDYTVVVAGNGEAQPLSLIVLTDDKAAPGEGNARLRVVHVAPFASGDDAGPISVRTDDGEIVGGMENLTYGHAGDAFEVPAGSYDLKITSTNGTEDLIDVAPVDLVDGSVTMLFATGDDVNEPLGMYAAPGGPLDLEAGAPGMNHDRLSGNWYNPETPGQGFGIHPILGEDRLFATWYTFDENGMPKWYALDTCATPGSVECDTVGFDGTTATFSVVEVTGGTFDGPGETQKEAVGELTVDFHSCLLASAVYTMGEQSGSFDLVNLTPIAACEASEQEEAP